MPELARLFRKERARFGRHFPHVRRAALELVSKPRSKAPRDMAYARGRKVTFYAPALALPRRNLLGLVRHELAHVALRGKRGEQAADDLAELVTGRRIRYDRRDLQTVGPGAWPRPRHLHR